MLRVQVGDDMGPIAPSLAQSESKAMFFRRLGLDEGIMMHRHLYTLMKRLTATRDSLVPSAKQDTSVEPPYTYSQMSDEAIQHEILEIYKRAKPETKILYDLGRDTSLGQEENWIIRWLLWHVFRYRDDRNSSLRRTVRPGTSGTNSSINIAPSLDYAEPAEPMQLKTKASLTQQLSDSSPPNHWYDPVRGVYRS